MHLTVLKLKFESNVLNVQPIQILLIIMECKTIKTETLKSKQIIRQLTKDQNIWKSSQRLPPIAQGNLKRRATTLKHAQGFVNRVNKSMNGELERTTGGRLSKHTIHRTRYVTDDTRGEDDLLESGLQSRVSLSNGFNILKQRLSKAGLSGSGGITLQLGQASDLLKTKRKRRPDLYRKFKAASWISIIIRRLCLANLKNTEDSDSPYMKNIKFVDSLVQENKGNLLFSVESFKANREMRLSEESKRILVLPTWARTKQDLLHAEVVLRSVPGYSDYPVTIQQKLAETGEYRKYEARRIIVREGHPAWNFYIILSGSVVVLVLDDTRSFVKPKAVLKRGMSFGELGLIHQDKRRSTIVAMEDTELLSIWCEDYESIFMDGGTNKTEDPFINSLPFLHGWPLELADDQPELFRYHFYKRSDIVVRDSSYSSWIIVVKSGSLDVLKKLKRVEAFEWRKRELLEKTSWKDKKPNKNGRQSVTSSEQDELEEILGLNLDPTNKKLEKNPNEVLNITKRSSALNPLSPNSDKAIPEINISPAPPSTSNKRHSVAGLQNIKEVEAIDEKSFKAEILTAANDLDKSAFIMNDKKSDADKNPMFVKVQTLTKGEVFGLCDIVLGQQPSFCVVSNGAEVIMIDKEFYSDNLNDTIRKAIMKEAQAYPSDEELQESLQRAVDWEAYRAITLQSAVKRNRRSYGLSTPY